MAEAWEAWASSRAQRAQCAEAVSRLTASCARDHPQHRHVLECRECYGKVLDCLSSRYLAPKGDGSEPEWFPPEEAKEAREAREVLGDDEISARDALRIDLEDLFAAAQKYTVDLDELDARLGLEKRRWYEKRVSTSPSIKQSLEDLATRGEILKRIAAKEVSFDEIVIEIRDALRTSTMVFGEAGAEGADGTLERLVKVGSPEEKVKAYKEAFFLWAPGQDMSGMTQAYFDQLESGKPLGEIVNSIIADIRSSKELQNQKKKHQQQLNDNLRARKQLEIEKAKKAGRKDSNPRPQPPDEMYDQPPCYACGRQLYLQDYVVCPLCQVLVDKGVRNKPTVFCSTDCVAGPQGQEAHVELAHDCVGRDNCAQLIDDDVDMDLDGSGPFLCKECTIDEKREAVFCSVRCADLNFQRHRERDHLPERRGWEFIVEKDADDLVFDDDNRERYHARDIRSHVIPMGELFFDFQQRNAIEIPENYCPD